MKKISYLLLLIFGILLLPNIIHAKELDIQFKNIQMLEKHENVSEENPPTIDKTTINFDLVFKELNDYITYKFEVVNNEDNEYTLKLESDDEYLTYELSKTTIAKKATTEINVTVKYNKAIPESDINKKRTAKAEIKIMDDKGNDVTTDVNPNTKIGIPVLTILIMLFSGTLLLIFKKKEAGLLVLSFLVIPLTVLALDEITFNINTTYEIRDLSGLRYKGFKLDEYEQDMTKIKTNIESMCTTVPAPKSNTAGRDDYFDFGVSFEPTSENSMNIMLAYPNANTHLNIETSAALEADAETGDTRVLVGECAINPELNVSDFTYDGEAATRDQVYEFLESKMCPSFRQVIESIDSECIYKIITNEERLG